MLGSAYTVQLGDVGNRSGNNNHKNAQLNTGVPITLFDAILTIILL